MTATLGNPLGVTDKRATQGSLTQPIANPEKYKDDTALNTNLTAADGTTYTTAYLAHMTENDKVYALRLELDAAGV